MKKLKVRSESMAIIKQRDIAEMDDSTIQSKIKELRSELHQEMGVVAAGGKAQNHGRMREIRRTVARLLTQVHQLEKGGSASKKMVVQAGQAAEKIVEKKPVVKKEKKPEVEKKLEVKKEKKPEVKKK